MPDSSPAHVCSVPTACMMSSFSSPVIVLPMIRRRHSPTPVARRLAWVAISSASIFEWVSYDFEQIISLQVSMSICVGPPDPDEFLVLDVMSS